MRERRFELPTFACRIPKDGYECDIITTRQLALLLEFAYSDIYGWETIKKFWPRLLTDTFTCYLVSQCYRREMCPERLEYQREQLFPFAREVRYCIICPESSTNPKRANLGKSQCGNLPLHDKHHHLRHPTAVAHQSRHPAKPTW